MIAFVDLKKTNNYKKKNSLFKVEHPSCVVIIFVKHKYGEGIKKWNFRAFQRYDFI